MARHDFRTDAQLERGLQAFAKKNKLTMSQAIRELLRQSLGAPPVAVDRGWLEGFAQGRAEFEKRLHGAASGE